MPEPIQPEYQVYKPTGIVDATDGNVARQGAMQFLSNLMPSPTQDGFFICRPGAFRYTAFGGFNSPGYVSCAKQVGNLVVGMIATARNAGNDEPFVYNKTTGAFVTVQGVTAANTPASPATSGAWTPPAIDNVGGWIIFTHPGFAGGGYFFGWLDITGFSSSSLTANAAVGSTVLSTVSSNPIIAGVTPGMTITGVNIVSTSRIVSLTSNSITMDTAASGSGATTLTIKGGSQSSPLWAAGNTNQNGLAAVPTSVSILTDRAYYAVNNTWQYSDVLNPLNISNASTVQTLTLGGNDNITATASQPFFTTNTGGIIGALLGYKAFEIWQVTGDLATNNLVLNKLITGVGTTAPRSVINTPEGVMFLANDGIRTVSLTGQVTEPNVDMMQRFVNLPTPSRVAAAYNVGFYRLCATYTIFGVQTTQEVWYNMRSKTWVGPMSLTYDLIIAFDGSFLTAGPSYTGQLLQSNVLPGPTDSFMELGGELSFNYETVLVPEFRAMPGWTLTECSVYMGFDAQIILTASVLDESDNTLGTYSITTNFLAPRHPTNWEINFVDSNGNAALVIPSRHSFQFSGLSTSGLAIGSVFAHYQYQSNNNALAFSSNPLQTPGGQVLTALDFGLVTDSTIHFFSDFGSVIDVPAIAIVDFEATGPIVGPP